MPIMLHGLMNGDFNENRVWDGRTRRPLQGESKLYRLFVEQVQESRKYQKIQISWTSFLFDCLLGSDLIKVARCSSSHGGPPTQTLLRKISNSNGTRFLNIKKGYTAMWNYLLEITYHGWLCHRQKELSVTISALQFQHQSRSRLWLSSQGSVRCLLDLRKAFARINND